MLDIIIICLFVFGPMVYALITTKKEKETEEAIRNWKIEKLDEIIKGE